DRAEPGELSRVGLLLHYPDVDHLRGQVGDQLLHHLGLPDLPSLLEDLLERRDLAVGDHSAELRAGDPGDLLLFFAPAITSPLRHAISSLCSLQYGLLERARLL